MKDNFVETCTSRVDEHLGDKFYSFKTECACFSHDLQVHLEKTSNPDIIEMTFYDDVYIGEDYDYENWFKNILFRLKCAWKCLFRDGFEIEHAFVFKGEEHLRQFQQYFNDRCNEILKVDTKPETKRIKRPRRNYKRKHSESKGE